MTEPLVEVRNLTKYFYEQDSLLDRLVGDEPVAIKAVDGLDFDIHRGETLGLVGESGCGKSTTGETLLRLQAETAGEVRFDGENIYEMSKAERKEFRRKAAIVFQDPFSSLDPRMTIGATVKQPLDVHSWPRTDPEIATDAVVSTDGIDPERVTVTVDSDIDKLLTPEDGVATASVTVERVPGGAEPADSRSVDTDGEIRASVREDLAVSVEEAGGAIAVEVSVGRSDETLRKERVKDLLNRVGLSGDQFDRYPHEFSGGQRQRVGIARALALDPEFVVLDEPTSALDVSVQAQILNLLDDLQEEFGLTYLLISHDLSVIRHICDRVAVMYLGEVVEIAPSQEIFSDPRHPYTKALLESVPRVNTDESERDIETLTGGVPSPRNPPSGCRFRTRCPSIIPPEGLDISQDAYREIVTLRDRIRERELDVSGAKEFAGTDDVDAVAERIVDRAIDIDLTSSHYGRVRTAVALAVDGNWEDADTELSAYETICEKVSPELQDGQTHLAACHLLDQPESVEATVEETGVHGTGQADD